MVDGRDASDVDPGRPGPGLEDAAAAATDPGKVRKKKDKVRAAWISFVGRILAQLIGAVATVLLGVYVVRTYGVMQRAPAAPPSASSATHAAATQQPRTRLSLVVLPFQAYVSGGAQDYLTDGLTEALITDLSRIEDLRVVSRTSSMFYKRTQKTLPAIARELDADLVIEGSVARDGDRVRVNVHLVDARTDTPLWARTYDRPVRSVLTLQGEVTTAIAQELHAVITPRQEVVQARRAGVGAAAVDAYLRGRHAFHRRAPADLQEAERLFRSAIGQAPRFALAHAALAETYCLMALDAFGAHAATATLDRAEQAATAAIAIDADSADAHLALAMVRHRRDWDWAGAEREFRRTFDLHESHATAHQWYSIFLAEQERTGEARQHAARALALDPRAAPVARTSGLVHLYARQYAAARHDLERALALDPASGVSRLMLAAIFIELRQSREARAVALPVHDRLLQDQRLALLAHAAALVGDHESVTALRAEADRLPGPRSLVAQARFAAALGDDDALIAAAVQALESRTQLACALKVHPVFARVRTHPRFVALVARVGTTS